MKTKSIKNLKNKAIILNEEQQKQVKGGEETTIKDANSGRSNQAD